MPRGRHHWLDNHIMCEILKSQFPRSANSRVIITLCVKFQITKLSITAMALRRWNLFCFRLSVTPSSKSPLDSSWRLLSENGLSNRKYDRLSRHAQKHGIHLVLSRLLFRLHVNIRGWTTIHLFHTPTSGLSGPVKRSSIFFFVPRVLKDELS